MQRILRVVALLLAMLVTGCGSSGSDPGPKRITEGPARLHPRWQATEVLLAEAIELQRKFDGLRPGNRRGQLAVLGQMERLVTGCATGYGFLECRRRGARSRIEREMDHALLPPSQRHVGLTMRVQIAVARYREKKGSLRPIDAELAGLRALILARRNYFECKGVSTCPYERAERIAARLRHEILGRDD
jgi:hypothetical protein